MKRNVWVLMLVVLCFSMVSCEDAQLGGLKMSEHVAQYMARPLHKAFYLNMEDKYSYWRSGGGDMQATVDAVEADCKKQSADRGSDPKRCTPVYIDEQQVLNWQQFAQ